MRLVAVFLEDQDRQSRGYTVNLGGSYLYDVDLTHNKCIIRRNKNEAYIDNFFDEEETVLNMIAIVGSNGAGKTTLIYKLINQLNSNFQSGFSIWEQNDKAYIKDYTYTTHPIMCIDFIIEQIEEKDDFDTIYYSAFIDHKAPPSGIDISADKYLKADLSNIDSTYDANERALISERLKRSDYNRFIKFQQSEFAEVIAERYGLLNEDFYRVIFTRHQIDIDRKTNKIKFKNTPKEFRDYLNMLYQNIRSEYKNIDTYASSDEESYKLEKKRFKNLILMDVFCLLIRLMEVHNFHLDETKISNYFKGENKIVNAGLDSYEQFINWLKIENHKNAKSHIAFLPRKEVIDILDYLFTLIDSFKYSEYSSNQLNWEDKSLYLKEEELSKLLDLNEKLLFALPGYYLDREDSQKHNITYEDLSHLQQFVSPEFANRRLSSGETAMLNLYSKLYDYFSMNVLTTSKEATKKRYILFLDEADLGYHPTWKISFVKTIIDFCKDFFKQIGTQVQIVFSTHDALSLSDIPKNNIIYLSKEELDFPVLIKPNDPKSPKHSFAANVTDILSDSFFLKDGLMGEFAKTKINELIEWLKKEGDTENKEYFRNLIDLIDEPLLKYKLKQMYSEKFPQDIDKERAKQQIKDIARRSGLDINIDDL